MRAFAFLLFAANLIPGVAFAEQEWIKATTPNFELYTTAGEGVARRAMRHFEQLRTFFLQTRGIESLSEQPVRIIGFRNPEEYQPYQPNDATPAHYFSWGDQDAIVIGDLRDQDRKTAIHEYVHLLVRSSKLNLPTWLNEGFADLYSSLTSKGGEVQIGALLPGRFQLLFQGGRWLEMETVLTANQDSPVYNAGRHKGMLYSQAWALTHMLNMDEKYRDKVADLVALVHAGTDSNSAFEQVYGLDPKELTTALQDYIHGDRFFGVVYDVKLKKSSLEPAVERASDLESRLILAQMLGGLPGRQKPAEQAYEELALDYPDDGRVAEALGYLAWRVGDREAARQHFVRAAELESQNPKIYYALASISHELGQADQVIDRLTQTLKYDPSHQDARRQVGFLYLQQEKWKQAIEHLVQVEEVQSKEDAFNLYKAQAYANYQLDRFDDADKAGELAKEFAQSPAQKKEAERMLLAVRYKRIAAEEAAKTKKATERSPFRRKPDVERPRP